MLSWIRRLGDILAGFAIVNSAQALLFSQPVSLLVCKMRQAHWCHGIVQQE